MFPISNWIIVAAMSMLTTAYIWALTSYQLPSTLLQWRSELVASMYSLAAMSVAFTSFSYIILEGSLRENFRLLKEARAFADAKGRYIAALTVKQARA
jgi:hypothetical protein